MLRRGLPRRYYSRPVDQTAQHSVQEALHFSCAGGVSRPHQRRRRRFTDAMVVKTAELASVAEEFERIGDLVAAVDSTAHAALAYRSQELRGSVLECSTRADALADACDGASTPAHRQATEPLLLTDRERDCPTAKSRSRRPTSPVRAHRRKSHLPGQVETGTTGGDELAALLPPHRA